EGHTDEVLCVAYRGDGRRLVTGGMDRTVRLWDVATGREVRTLGETAAAARVVAYSPDRRWVAAGTAGSGEGNAALLGEVGVWDAQTGKPIRFLEGHGAPVLGVAFGPDGEHVASAGYDQVAKVWSTRTWQKTAELSGHQAAVAGVAFSPDGKRVASASYD